MSAAVIPAKQFRQQVCITHGQTSHALRMHRDAYRNGSPDAFLDYFAGSAPKLPQNARQAIEQLVKSRPQFYPIPSWTYLSQLHGPKVHFAADSACMMWCPSGVLLIHDQAVYSICSGQHAHLHAVFVCQPG